MLNSNEFLESCSKLSELGLKIPIKVGSRVSRGFADLGYEEFYLLPSNKLLSIYTAKTSDWLKEHQKFFFAVPDADQIISAIRQELIDVKVNLSGIEWQVVLKNNHKAVENTGSSIINLLIKSYLELKS